MRIHPYMVQGLPLRGSSLICLISSLSSIATSIPLRLVADRGTSSTAQVADPYSFDRGAAKPKGHFTLDSTKSADWPRERQKNRKRLLSSSDWHAADLKRLQGDDSKDSFLWGNLSEFKADDTSQYWDDLCNGTNVSKSNPLPGDTATSKLNMKAVLSKWQLQSNASCTELASDTTFSDPMEAFKKCGATCDGLSYTKVNATAQKIKLCAVGGFRKLTNSSTANFVYNKPADFVSPKGQPRPPVELKFWSDFCKYRIKGRQLRIMFEGQNCVDSAVKALKKAANPVECAEAASKDADCSKVFDFRFGPPTVCRCLKKDLVCSPTLSKAGHVYAPSLT